MRYFKRGILFLLFLWQSSSLKAQQNSSLYPRIAEYLSIVHPVISINKSGASYNFQNSYTVGFPCGINVLKSDRMGFSFEITPFIYAANGNSKVTNFFFHPGILFRGANGFTFIGRVAFETSGRYGVTAVFSRVIIRSGSTNYFIAVPVPIRFGNEKPPSAGASVQFGILF